jgi:hypothetical protein
LIALVIKSMGMLDSIHFIEQILADDKGIYIL